MREYVLASPDVIGVAPYVEGQGLLMAERRLAGVQVRGIDPALEPDVSVLAALLRHGSLGDLESGAYRTLIGTALAAELGVGVGDSVVLMLAQGSVTPVGLTPRMRRLHVAGTFEAGMFEYDRGLIYVHLEDAARLYRTGGEATGLRLAVTDIFQAGRVSAQLARALGGGFFISDWSRQHVNFLSLHSTHQVDHVRHVLPGHRGGGLQHPLHPRDGGAGQARRHCDTAKLRGLVPQHHCRVRDPGYDHRCDRHGVRRAPGNGCRQPAGQRGVLR